MLALLLVLALFAAACGSDAETGTETESETESETETESEAETESETESETEAESETESESEGGAEEGASGAFDIDAALAADLDSCVEAPTGDPIIVGMAMDFSEISGFADVPGSKATEHLAALINCTGGFNGSPIEVRVSDMQGDPEVATRVAQELVEGGAHFIIGPPFADTGEAILQVTEGGVAVFFAASTEPNLPDASINSYLVTFDDTAQATAAAEYALDQGLTRAFTFSSPGPYFGYNPEVFTEVFTAGGGEVIADQTYVPVDDVDFSAQVNEIAPQSENNEVVYSAMLSFQLTALRGQLEGQDLDGLTYMATDSFEATGGLFGENIEGIVHTTHAFIDEGGRIDLLLKSYETANGEGLDSGTFAGLYSDSMLVGLQGIADCGCTDPAGIGAAVAQIEGFNGFTGEMGYAGTNGIPVKPVSIHQVVDGVDVLVGG